MNREVITTGKTVEDATQEALKQLGLSIDEVVVEVLEMPQRRFFRTIPAKVRVTVEEAETLPADTAKKEEIKPQTAVELVAEELEEDKPAVVETPKEKDLPVKTESRETPINLADYPHVIPVVDYLKQICIQMGVEDISITGAMQGETILLKADGSNVGLLIGHRGEVMEALSYLCSLVANRSGGEYVKLGLDISSYRGKREANLTSLAKRLAEKCVRTGRAQTLEPMNPYERRIVHAAVSEVEGAKSESTGEGTSRRVIILPQDMEVSQVRRTMRQLGRRGTQSVKRGENGNGRSPRRNQNYVAKGGAARRLDRAEQTHTVPTKLRRTESINDGENLPLYGKVEL